MKKIRIVLEFCLVVCCLSAQNTKNEKGFVAAGDIFGSRVFIENKGQFKNLVQKNESILYAYQNGLEKIYFTTSGLIYELKEKHKPNEEDFEKFESGKSKRPTESPTYYTRMQWQAANLKTLEVIASDKQNHYFTYGEIEFNANTFKKITYKNVYPNIDIEYTLPDAEKHGIKYTIRVHSGGNIDQIKILYSGNIKKIKSLKNGGIQIKTPLKEPITEHSPVTFDSDQQTIDCQFKLLGDTISFKLNSTYDKKKMLIIDPWVTTITSFQLSNFGYDVDYDGVGNTYIYGGLNSFKVAKYSATGSLVWTFSGVIPSISWNSQTLDYAGNFCVDKFSGKAYIGQGANFTGSQIVRINSAGNYDNFVSVPTASYQEVWDMSINCSTGNVFTLGGGHNSNLSAAVISNLDMSLSFATFQPSNLDPRQDIASHCIDDNGTVFVIYSTDANAVLNDKICRVNAGFNGNVWTQSSGHVTMAEAANKSQFYGSGSGTSNGLNCLAVNSSYLYYYDGVNLTAYSVATGAMIANTNISGGSLKERAGIAVDDCNTLYLGGLGQVLVYTFTGSSFNALSPITLTTSATAYVYDIKLNKSTKMLFVCGNEITANVSAVNSTTCNATSPYCISNYPANYKLCGGMSATLTPINYLNLSGATYSVLPGPISNSTGTFVVTPYATTTYTTYITGTNTNNAVVTLTNLSTVTVTPTFTIIPTAGNLVLTCNQPSINISYIPSYYNYVTSNGVSSPITGTEVLFTSDNYQGTWTVTVSDPTSGCVKTQTLSVSQNTVVPATTLTPLYQVITCTSSSVPVFSQVNPTVNVQHQWMAQQGGSLSVTHYTSSFLPGIPGTYTHCSVNLTNGCSSCQTFTVFANTGFPNFNIQSPQNFSVGCATKSLATMNITNGQTTPPGGSISYCFLPPGFSGPSLFSGTSSTNISTPGTWTLIVKDLLSSCESKVQVSVIQNIFGPKLDTLLIPRYILDCAHFSVTLEGISSTPNTSFNWSFPANPGNVQGSSLLVNANTQQITNTLVATYSLTLTDNNNACLTKTTVTIAQNLFPPIATFSMSAPALSCLTTSVTLTNQSKSGIPASSGFITTNFVVAYLWQGPSPQSNAENASTYKGYFPGAYTLTAKDLTNGCTSTATAILLDNVIYPNVNLPNAPQPFVLPCESSSVTIAPLFIPDPAYSFSWTSPTNTIITGNINTPSLVTTSLGVYTIQVTNTANGCVRTATVIVIQDTLKAHFIAEPETGFAPMPVIFTNLSSSKTGNQQIKTYWSFGNGVSLITDSIQKKPRTIYTHPGTYQVKAFVTKGICLDTASAFITVDLSSSLEIPNIFTPNNDGVNDLFFLKTAGLEKIEITIFDRWGTKVFEQETQSSNVVWDGKNQLGIEVADGVFLYILKASGKDGKKFTRQGNVTLVR